MSFFRKWYTEKIKKRENDVRDLKELVKSGRLDLINGGLVQHDEAGSHVKETYENLEEGLRFLYEEFNVTPSAFWQLDPFGHSSSSPEVFKSLGINKVVLDRISDAYKNELRIHQDLDFIWTGDGEEEIYAHVLHGMYGIDLKFYFDRRWGASHKCPNPLNEQCVKELIEESVHQGVKVHNGVGYVMQLIGNDFFYQNADFSFNYIDGMKKSFEQYGHKFVNGAKCEFKYATLSEYYNEVLPLNYTIGRYNGDFFVYTQYHPSNRFYDHHWGGYFASRPLIKWQIRDALSRERSLNSLMGILNFARNSKISHIDSKAFWNAFSDLMDVREFSSVMLHHDAITGTHGVTVNRDYKRIIQRNNDLLDKVEKGITNAFTNIANHQGKITEFTFYNPSLYTRTEIYNITIGSPYVEFDKNHDEIGEIIDSYQLNQKTFQKKSNEYILFVKVSIPPLQHKTISIKEYSSKDQCGSR